MNTEVSLTRIGRTGWIIIGGMVAFVAIIATIAGMLFSSVLGASLWGLRSDVGRHFKPLVQHVGGETPNATFCYDDGSQFCETKTRLDNPSKLGTMGFMAAKKVKGVNTETLYSCSTYKMDNLKIALGDTDMRISCKKGGFPRVYNLGELFLDDKVEGAKALYACVAKDDGNSWLTFNPEACSLSMHESRYDTPKMLGYVGYYNDYDEVVVPSPSVSPVVSPSPMPPDPYTPTVPPDPYTATFAPTTSPSPSWSPWPTASPYNTMTPYPTPSPSPSASAKSR